MAFACAVLCVINIDWSNTRDTEYKIKQISFAHSVIIH